MRAAARVTASRSRSCSLADTDVRNFREGNSSGVCSADRARNSSQRVAAALYGGEGPVAPAVDVVGAVDSCGGLGGLADGGFVFKLGQVGDCDPPKPQLNDLSYNLQSESWTTEVPAVAKS